MLRLDISHDAAAFIARREPKHRRQISGKIVELRNNPNPTDSIQMKGSEYRRTDIGEYRIVYKVVLDPKDEDDILKIITVDKRNDSQVYRRSDRK